MTSKWRRAEEPTFLTAFQITIVCSSLAIQSIAIQVMDFDEMDEPVLVTANSRKKRYSGEGSVASIVCSHNNLTCAAVTLTPTDLGHITGQLYSTSRYEARLHTEMNLLDHFSLFSIYLFICCWKIYSVCVQCFSVF